MNQVKLLAAGLLVACGLGVSGAGWLSTADAQYVPPGMPLKPAERVKRLEEELAKAKKEAESATLLTRYTEVWQTKSDKRTAIQTAKWEYEFVEMAETFDAANLALFLQEREKAGWEFLGSSALAKNGGVPMWVFRRPRVVTPLLTAKSAEAQLPTLYRSLAETTKTKPADPTAKPIDPVLSKPLSPLPNQEDAKAIEAEIKRLQGMMMEIKGKEHAGKTWVMVDTVTDGLDSELVGKLLASLGIKKFGKGEIQVLVTPKGLNVYGTKEVTNWANQMVKKMSEK